MPWMRRSSMSGAVYGTDGGKCSRMANAPLPELYAIKLDMKKRRYLLPTSPEAPQTSETGHTASSGILRSCGAMARVWPGKDGVRPHISRSFPPRLLSCTGNRVPSLWTGDT